MARNLWHGEQFEKQALVHSGAISQSSMQGLGSMGNFLSLGYLCIYRLQ